MKKVRLIALILVICMFAFVFTACDEIFKLNEERDFNQIVATVKYTTTVNGQSSTQSASILKGDLQASYNSYGYVYMNYYKMTAQEACDTLLDSLVQRRALIMFAKAYLITNKIENVNTTSLPENVKVESLLTDAEINRAIELTNDDMLESLKSVITQLISDEESNNATTTPSKKPTANSDEIFKVRFDSDGGSAVSTQRVQDGLYAEKPENPTKDGYQFAGWFLNGELYDFETPVTGEITLTAKWYEYTAPRTVMPEAEEEEEEFDPQVGVTVERLPYFFSDEYLNPENSYLNFDDLDYDSEKYFEKLQDGLDELRSTLKKSYRDYNYFLTQQMETVLLEKFQRAINDTQSVSADDVQKEYESLIAQNKENFTLSGAYETSLKSSLTNTLYHSYTDANDRYGFVTNILLKFNADELKQLTDLVSAGNSTVEQIKDVRDALAKSHMVLISNPFYDPEAECENQGECKEENCDPMTCPNHSCNQTDENTEEQYNKMIEFVVTDGKAEIKYNITECATMAYMLTEWPAFTQGTKIGVVEQFANTMAQVDSYVTGGQLTVAQGIYWKQQLAKAWLYLVGDDTGATSSDSNNNGLGYLVKPESAGASGYISEFEELARDLISQGTASYGHVVGENFIDEKSTSTSPYAGIFIIFTTYVPYDTTSYAKYSTSSWETEGQLPLDYIITFNEEGGVTVNDLIEESLLSSKQTKEYNSITNEFINQKKYSVEKFDKVIQKIYED